MGLGFAGSGIHTTFISGRVRPGGLDVTAKYALLSLTYMITFVLLFDRFHYKRKLMHWLCGSNLMEQDELQRIQAIWAACQEN
jgi:hypothetical protein